METVEQFDGWTIKQHCEDVWYHTKQLICGNFEGFRLPDWFKQNHHFIVNNLHKWGIISTYNRFHDGSKSFVLTVDENGKRHFPNHAVVSEQLFREATNVILEASVIDGGHRGDNSAGDNYTTASLIGLDMMFHSGDVDWTLPIKTLTTLMITAFAEIHSNAKQFPGGIESTSFKIKYKRLDKLGKRLIEKLPRHEDSYSYLIVRNDLPDAQKVVQASHATWEGSSEMRRHPSLVCLVVKNEAKLKKTMAELIENDIQFSIFREPLFDNTITAICTEPLIGEKREVLKRYQLL